MKQIAERISRAGIEGLFGAEASVHNGSERDTPKKLDVVAVSPSISSLYIVACTCTPSTCPLWHEARQSITFTFLFLEQLGKACQSIGRTECGMWMSCT